jgi:ribosomal-protein-alanine N-acetyltransferase
MNDALVIRLALSVDVGAIARLHHVCFEEAWSEQAVGEVLAAPGSVAWLATLEGEPVGFAIARQAGDDAELLSLGVDPTTRRRSIARRLVETVIVWAGGHGAHLLFLEVAEDNDAARALYADYGYAPVGRRPDYYRGHDGRPVAALTMRLTLAPQRRLWPGGG